MNQEQMVATVVSQALKQLGMFGDDPQLSGRKASGTPAGPYAHGPGGLFSLVDGEHPILSAMIQPEGLLSVLPMVRADEHVTDLFTTMTGVTAGSGTEPEGVCDDPRTAGLKKLCTIAVPMGRNRLKSREWDIPSLGKLKDRSEELSLTASFPISLFKGDRFFPMAGVPTQGNAVARTELGNRLFEMAVEYQRTIGPLIYTGDPTNNTGTDPRTAGYKEPMGLDLWINQNNKRDYIASAVCTALNSDIKDFAYSDIEGTDRSIVQYITYMVRWCEFNARHMRLWPATWRLAMVPDLFNVICDIWPCEYMADRCLRGGDRQNILVVNDDKNIRMRDEMRTGNFLWVDGKRIPVTQDMYITEYDWVTDSENLLEGQFSSDIYYYPETVLGGITATGMQYFNQAISAAQNLMVTRDKRVWSTDNGLFLWNSTSHDLCFDVRVLTEWRLYMLTPQIAGRITNVMYAPLQHMRQWDPDAKYYANGGITERPVESFYNSWGTTPSQF